MIDLYELNKKLIGPIEPCAESNFDDKRLDNIIRQMELVEVLLKEIHEVARDYKNRQEASVYKIQRRAQNFIDYIHEEYPVIL